MTLERLPAALKAPWAVGPSNPYRLLIVHLLLGDRGGNRGLLAGG